MDRTDPKSRVLLLAALLCLVTVATFWPVQHHDFIKLDDNQYVTGNPRVLGGLTWGNAAWAFQTGYAANWHPLTWLSHMLDTELFGRDPGGAHLTSLFFHTANTLLLFLLLWRMTGSEWRSAVVAALFAVHPLHVESVAWIAERKDVLSAFFFLLTLVSYVEYAKSREETSERRGVGALERTTLRRSPRCYALSLAFFAFGLMSKPMLVTLPFVLLLLDYWPLRRFENQKSNIKNTLYEKLPFLCLAGVSSLVTLWAQAKGHALSAGLPMGPRVANALTSYLQYLGKTFWPANLAVFYPHPYLVHFDPRAGASHLATGQWPLWQILAAAAAPALISGLALLRRDRQPWFVVGWFWYLGTLVPVLGIVQVGAQAMADRYTYIPLIGIFICCAWGAADLLRACLKTHPWVAQATGLFRPATRRTERRQRFELIKTGLSQGCSPQFRSELEQHKSCPLCGLGRRPGRAGRPRHPFFKHALSQWRLGRVVLAALGVAVIATCTIVTRRQLSYWQNNYTVFEHALRATPNNAVALFNVGTEYADRRQYGAALAYFRSTLTSEPTYADAYFAMGDAYLAMGKEREAAEAYEAGLRLRPWYEVAHNRLGTVLWRLGKKEEALQHYVRAMELNPNYAEAHFNTGLALSEIGDLNPAAAHFTRALRARPDYPEAADRLAEILLRQGKSADARCWSTLDVAYAETGRFAEAIRAAEKARDLAAAAGETVLAQAAAARLELYHKQQR